MRRFAASLVMSLPISPPSWDSSGAMDSGVIDPGAVDSAAVAVGSAESPGVDVQAARTMIPAIASDVGFQIRT